MTKDELFKNLKIAIDNEYNAYQLYKEIAETSGFSELRVIFERIAGEELSHRETIMERYAILKEIAD